VDELFGLRDLLERYAMTQALPLPDSQGLVRLAGALESMGAAAQDRDVFREHEAHRQFHIEVVALAGQRHLLQAFEPVILKLELCMAANLRLEAEQRDAAEGVRRHRKLLDAIASGDLDAVLGALASHGARTYIG
jgi:DNA-binding GntR family transcriptional regulator